MPVVPRYDTPQVEMASQPNVRIDAPQMPDVAGRQAQQLGQALQQTGDTFGKMGYDMASQANQLRIDDALNQAKEAALRLAYDKNDGFTSLKGINALDRPDGKPLADEYGDKLREHIDGIAGSLGNDFQRAAFSRASNDILTSFKGQAIQHEAGEFKTYGLSVSEGVQATALRDIGVNWNNPEAVNAAVERIKAETYRQAQLLGKSAEWQEAQDRKMSSNGHKVALLSALEQNDPAYADAYLKKYSGQMDADDILAVRGHITKEMDARVGMGVAAEVVGKLQSQFNPSSLDNVVKITMGSESGGNRYGADGQLLTSPKGAKGEMQVLDGTNKDPGFGVKPAKDDSPDERARVGRDYLGAMAQRYSGDMAKMWAAYNAGPGAVDMAIAKSQPKASNDFAASNWLSHLPAETQAYVAKNLKAYETGEGRASKPTFSEIDDQLRADPRLANSPARYQVAREEAMHQFEEQTKAIKQRDEDAVANAMRGVMQNGGRWTDLPASIRSSVPPDEVTKVMSFAQRVSKGDDSTSLLLYQRLTGNPQALATMSDNAFFALRTELSEADFKHFANERAKLTGAAPDSHGPGDLNTQAIKQTLDQRLRTLNIDPKPKDDGGDDAARLGGIRQFVDQYMYSAQREAGKKFSDAEVTEHIDKLMAMPDVANGWFSNKGVPMLSMKASDISSADKEGLTNSFKKYGITDPTDAQILGAYWMKKVTRK